MPPLNVGLIGCGRIAQLVHLRLLSAMPGVELAALAEPDAEQRAAARRLAPQAAPFADYRELVDKGGVEAVVICLPTGLHAEAATAALNAGVHVYLEKPMAASVEEGRHILEAWKRSGCIGMIGFNYRFHPLIHDLRGALQAGRIGQITGVQTVFATAGSQTSGWRSARASGGGALLELASHHLDLVRYLFQQEIHEVFARLRSMRTEHDGVTLQLRLANGLDVQTFAAFGTIEEDSIAVYGANGKLWLDRYRSLDLGYSAVFARFTRLRTAIHSLRNLTRLPYWIRKTRSPAKEPSYQVSLTHFVEAVRSGRRAEPSLLDGYRNLLVIAAAEESARTGRPVVPAATAHEDTLSE